MEEARRLVIHNGYQPPPRAAIVLLSGLDSAAALHWALERHAPVVALGFAYGQPDAELAVSQAIAERRGCAWVREIVPGIGVRASTPGRDERGVSRANVPGRNGILAWHAANVAARLFPGGRVALVVGCNLDDSAGFPDCRPEFLAQLGQSLAMGLAGVVDIDLRAPWAPWLERGMRKAEIVRWALERPPEVDMRPGFGFSPPILDLRYAVSCYQGTRCGVCDACTLRARAFAEAGVEDGNEPPPAVHGGDPAREFR